MSRPVSMFRLALSLAQIPRLFAALFLVPLILSLGLVYIQLLVTGIWIGASRTDSQNTKQTLERVKEHNLARLLLYGQGAKLGPVKICRWIWVKTDQGEEGEVPPSSDCQPDLLDVAVHTDDPGAFDIEAYQKLLDGNVERIHVCQSCAPQVVIDTRDTKPNTTVQSVWGLMVLSLIKFNDNFNQNYLQVVQEFEELRNRLGPVTLQAHGFAAPVRFKSINTSMAIIINIAMLVIVTMWLALKAHRKVLDYFSHSGALLPMVAATGKSTFYGALWLLTIFRVAAFLAAAVPMIYFGLLEIGHQKPISEALNMSLASMSIWLFGLVTSFLLATVVSSIAELKQRHNIASLLFRYLPIALAALGLVLWGATFFVDSTVAGTIRQIVTALPIVGMGPIIVGPVFRPLTDILAVHAILSVAAIALILKHNARWFAAHLEDI